MALHLLLLKTLVFHFPFTFWKLQHDALFLEARFRQFFLFPHLLHSRQTNRGAPSPQSNTKNRAVVLSKHWMQLSNQLTQPSNKQRGTIFSVKYHHHHQFVFISALHDVKNTRSHQFNRCWQSTDKQWRRHGGATALPMIF